MLLAIISIMERCPAAIAGGTELLRGVGTHFTPALLLLHGVGTHFAPALVFLQDEVVGDPDSFFNRYLNYPGFEAWKFFNLFLFIAIMYFLLRKPLGDAFRTRREVIRRELIRAQEEREAAGAKLAEVEARLAKLDAETAAIREQADREAAAESARIAQLTVDDAAKLREQARREIEAAGKTVKQDLRRFAAEESVKLAEQMIRGDIRPDDDARLIANGVQELGGVRG